MTVNPEIQNAVAAAVLAEQAAREKREPSGRLSASRLGWPIQWMALHRLKVPRAEPDEFTLRKFQRGNDVEDRIVSWLNLPAGKKQVAVEYRGVVGYADAVMSYPIEIKSCTNMAFKHKMKDGPSRSHRLQGMLYAEALGFDTFGVAYVASDDYRVLCFEEPVTDEVDEAIDAYEAQVKTGTVPVFEAKEGWQANAAYSAYPEWMKLTEAEIVEKVAAHLAAKTNV